MLGIGAAKRLALEHLAGGKALAHDQTPSFSTRVSEVVQCVLWCAQSKVNTTLIKSLFVFLANNITQHFPRKQIPSGKTAIRIK